MKNELLKNWFKSNFESRILGRYITLNHLDLLLKDLQQFAQLETHGVSENGVEIPILKIGSGSKKVLAWSQMHGNESTTTKGVFDFLKFLQNKELYNTEIDLFLKSHTFYVIPILNPDGAILNTRENFNEIDLNRDADTISQSESTFLRMCFERIQPDLCLNLHDQRSIFGLDNGNPAAISFLAPAANKKRTMVPARETAIDYINKAIDLLKEEIPNSIGRFDDAFNINCVGDTFTTLKSPTILIEAGHSGNDYEREQSRYYVFLALTGILLNSKNTKENDISINHYINLPENRQNFTDILLKNVAMENGKLGIIGCQYREVLVDETVEFQLMLDSINSKSKIYGHIEYDLNCGEVLINSQKKYHIGQKVHSIFDVIQAKSIY